MTDASLSPKGLARREQIVQAAFDEIAREGYRGATLGRIARALELQTPHIIYYFGTREQLLVELIDRWDRADPAPETESPDYLETFSRSIHRNLALRGIVHLYLSLATEAADERHPAHDYFRSRFDGVVTELGDVFTAGQTRGLIRTSLEPALLARMTIALADGLQLQSLIDPTVDPAADLDAVIDDLFIDGTRRPIRGAARSAAVNHS